MLEEAFRDMEDGFYIQSRQNADLFTDTHFRAKTKKNTNILVIKLLFANDSALIAHSAEEIQRIVDVFAMHHQSLARRSTRKRASNIQVWCYKANIIIV